MCAMCHLRKDVDEFQAILAEEERLIILRFGHDWDGTCMQEACVLMFG